MAVGGNGHAKGGDGGDADTGNKQFGNGNSLAVSPGGKPERSSHGKGSRHESETRSEGGDTHAKSGDAYGGNGGDAKARGGTPTPRIVSRPGSVAAAAVAASARRRAPGWSRVMTARSAVRRTPRAVTAATPTPATPSS